MNDLNWDPSQLHALAREGPGPVLVRGRAGSGRTAVAIGHALHLVRQQTITERRILFVTPFSLAAASASAAVLSQGAAVAREISVTSLSSLCRDLITRSGRTLTQAPDDVRSGFLNDAIAVLKRRKPRAILGRSPVFFSEEISEVIKGRALGRREEYLSLEREGRWRGLEQPVRETVWEVFEEYQMRLEGAGLHDADDLFLLALAAGAVNDDSGFDEVIVDDVHGLNRAGLLVLARLAVPSDRLFLLVDEDQRYHRQGFSLKDAGIDARRSVELTGSYRPATPIRAFAETILHGETMSDAERSSVLSVGGVAILETRGYADQFSLAAECVQAEIGRGGSDVALLTPSARDLLAARRALDSAAVAPDAAARVRMMTIDDARGLEFASVILVGINDGVLPLDEAGHELTGKFRDRRRLYVAVTRARERLAIICQTGLRSSFLPPVGSDAFRAAGSGPPASAGSS